MRSVRKLQLIAVEAVKWLPIHLHCNANVLILYCIDQFQPSVSKLSQMLPGVHYLDFAARSG